MSEDKIYSPLVLQDLQQISKVLMRAYVEAYGDTGKFLFNRKDGEIWTDMEGLRMQLAKALVMGTAFFTTCKSLGIDPIDLYQEVLLLAIEADFRKGPVCPEIAKVQANLRTALESYKNAGPIVHGAIN